MKQLLEYFNLIFEGSSHRFLFLFFFSFLFAFLLTFLIKRIAIKLKILDIPTERKIHKTPTPLLGGAAVFLAFVWTVFLNFSFSIELKGIVLGGAIIFLMGLVDDLRAIPALWKLLGQILASIVLLLHGIQLSFLPNTWWGNSGEILLTIIWVIGITNAVNFFDGMDGLATGVTVISSLSFFAVAYITQQQYLGFLTITLAGSCLGFLIHNFKPASIFLGDAGSTFLGFTLAGIAIMGGWAQGNPKVALSLPILILSIFIFDMIYITVARILNGKVKNLKEWIEYTGKDHLHHRLVNLGLNEAQTVLFIYLISGCLGISGILLRASEDLRILFLFLQSVFIFIIISILMLERQKIN